MNEPISWLKASDGTAAVDMQVALITPWIACGPKDRPSLQVSWPDGPVGSFSLEFSNVKAAGSAPLTYDATPIPYPESAYLDTPDQPAGTAGDNIFSVDSIGEYVRGKYTPTEGQEAAGALKLPTETFISYTQDREE